MKQIIMRLSLKLNASTRQIPKCKQIENIYIYIYHRRMKNSESDLFIADDKK